MERMTGSPVVSEYRHEYKYIAPEYILSSLEHRLSAVLRPDVHVGRDGCYHIRSIYFDDGYNTCYQENMDGTDPREKFRLRIYNRDPSRITLELKRKRRGKNVKLSAPFSYERCQRLLAGERLDLRSDDGFLYKRFYAQVLSRRLHPVVMVCYERFPFVWRQGNVRVTLDRNIRSSSQFSRFFDVDLPARPVLPCATNLLEVKFDDFLPDFIYELLQTNRLSQTTFSKYFLCRRYNMVGMAPLRSFA